MYMSVIISEGVENEDGLSTADSDLLVHHCFAVFLNKINKINSEKSKNSISLPILIEI